MKKEDPIKNISESLIEEFQGVQIVYLMSEEATIETTPEQRRRIATESALIAVGRIRKLVGLPAFQQTMWQKIAVYLRKELKKLKQ